MKKLEKEESFATLINPLFEQKQSREDPQWKIIAAYCNYGMRLLYCLYKYQNCNNATVEQAGLRIS